MRILMTLAIALPDQRGTRQCHDHRLQRSPECGGIHHLYRIRLHGVGHLGELGVERGLWQPCSVHLVQPRGR